MRPGLDLVPHPGQRSRRLLSLSLPIVASALCLLFAQPSRSNSIEGQRSDVAPAIPRGKCLNLTPDKAFIDALSKRGAAVPPERRVALVMGNGAYERLIDNAVPGRLPNAPRDATSVAQTLRSLGFLVVAGVDLDKEASLKCLSDFYEQAEGATAAVLYFAGHGMSAGGNTYLLPVDAQIDTQASVGRRFLQVNGRGGVLQNMRQRATSYLFLDACRTIAFPGGTRAGQLKMVDGEAVASGGAFRGLAPLRDSDGGVSGLRDFYYVYSTFPGETAADGGEGESHSPFTRAFLRHVGRPGLDVPRLLLEMSPDVVRATNGAQHPWGEGAIKAETNLYFNGRQTLEEMRRASEQLAVEADNLRNRGLRSQAIATAMSGLPVGNSRALPQHFGPALAALYRAVASRNVIVENRSGSCASLIALSPDSRRVVSVMRGKNGNDCDSRLRDTSPPAIWDTRSEALIKAFDMLDLPSAQQFDHVFSANFSPDGRNVLLEVQLRDARLGVPLPNPARERATRAQLQWWDASSGRYLRSLDVQASYSKPYLTLNATRVVKICSDEGCHKVEVFDASDGKLLQSFDTLLAPVLKASKTSTNFAGKPLPDSVKVSGLSADGRLFFVMSADNGLGGVWDLSTGKSICSIDLGRATVPDRIHFDSRSFRGTPASFDREGRRLVFTRDNQTVRVFDVNSCKETRTITQNTRSFLTRVELSPDGRSVFTAMMNLQARIWSVSTGELLRTLVGHTDWIRESSFSLDSKLLVTASDDGSVRVWGVDRDQARHTIWPSPGFITTAIFSRPDGRIATVSDGLLHATTTNVPSVQIWSASGSTPAAVAQWKDRKVVSIQFSPNGRRILGWSSEGFTGARLNVWDSQSLELQHDSGPMDDLGGATFLQDSSTLAVVRGASIELWKADGHSFRRSQTVVASGTLLRRNRHSRKPGSPPPLGALADRHARFRSVEMGGSSASSMEM